MNTAARRSGCSPGSLARWPRRSLAALRAATGAARRGTSVVTSFYPLQYVAQRIAGDHADVTNLTQPGQEPHDLELTVRQTAELADADVVRLRDGASRPPSTSAVDQNGRAATSSTPPRCRPRPVAGDDPHFWLDPTRLAAVAGAVDERARPTIDPAHARRLRPQPRRRCSATSPASTAAYADGPGGLRARHDRGQPRRVRLPRPALRPRRGRRSPASPPTPSRRRPHLRAAAGPDPQRRHHHRLLRGAGQPASSPTRLAGDLGIATAVLDPIEGLSDATADEDYLSLMRANLAALEKANGCS